jgi:methyl-accepting chemotaxis protein
VKPAALVSPEPSTLDTIANLLPTELQARFYKRMAHMRKLPADDEVLQIAEAMGFLALIIQQAPGEVAVERGKMAELLQAALTHLKASEQATAAYHKNLDQRLTKLPTEIGQSLKPEVIGARIGEELRQRFAQTGMSQTADAMNVISTRLQQALKEINASIGAVSDPKMGALPRIDQALGQMYTSLSQAAERVNQISSNLHTQVERSVFALTGGALAIGFLLGMLFYKWVLGR